MVGGTDPTEIPDHCGRLSTGEVSLEDDLRDGFGVPRSGAPTLIYNKTVGLTVISALQPKKGNFVTNIDPDKEGWMYSYCYLRACSFFGWRRRDTFATSLPLWTPSGTAFSRLLSQ